MHKKLPLLFPLALFLVVSFSQAVDKPSFIIIFTDDQGYNDLGCFGSKKIKTPNIDSLAMEGKKFTSFYVASPLCTPSRSALLTGCYPIRVGMEKGVISPSNKHGLHPDEVTIADLLKDAGYATACVGKWHLGHEKPFLPTSQGFNSYFGIPYSNDMSHPDNKNKPKMSSDELWANQDSNANWKTPLMIDEDIVEVPVDQRTITRRYTDQAIKFITDNKEKPFFLYLPHSMPHIPLYVPSDVYDPNPQNAYTNVVQHIDAEVGRLLNAVKELGLNDNTFIIFTSDNGPWLPYKNHGGSALPLRDGKGKTYEGGQRVPCLIKGPGIPAASVSDEMLATIDLLPSIAKFAGIELKTRGPIDGLDARAFIQGQAQSPRSEFAYYSPKRELQAIRQGEYKLRITQDKKGGPAIELYNLTEDISESHNLAEQMPEKVAALSKRMQEVHAELVSAVRPRGEE